MKKQLQKLSEFFIKNFEEDFENTLEDILTPEEIENIYERIMILQYLKNGLTQREIAKDLWVSIGTVSRWSRILQYWKREGNLNF